MQMMAKDNKGIALVTALVILVALTLMAMMMVNTSTLDTKISGVTKEQKQAFFLAEAGIARVSSLFKEALRDENGATRSRGDTTGLPVVTAFYDGANYNGPWGTAGSVGVIQYTDEYMGGTYTALQWRFFRKRLEDAEGVPQFIDANFSQFADPNGDGYDDAEDAYNILDGAPANAPDGASADFRDRYGRPAFYIFNQPYLDAMFNDFAEGRVIFIGIYPPIGMEQSPQAEGERPICTVRVEVETPSGFRRMIEQELMEPPVLPITAGAQAAGTAAWDGAARIRWGDLKSKKSVVVGNNGKDVPYGCPNAEPDLKDCIATEGTATKCYDKWFTGSVGAGETISMPGGWTETTDLNCDTDCLGCADKNAPATRPYLNHALYENQNVKIDYWKKDVVKSYASSINSIYTYDGTNFYRGDFSGSIPAGTPPISFGTLFNPNGEYMGKTEFVYVQMTTGVTTLNFDPQKISGKYTQGSLYVDGSVNFSGGGGGKEISVQNPDQYNGGYIDPDTGLWVEVSGNSTLTGVNFEGVLYATGEIGGTGTVKIFGGVLAETGQLALSGSSEVWYDESLKEDAGPKQPSTQKSKWRELKP